MTDRVRTLTVTLDRDYRTDDVQAVINGIQMIKGVSGVTWSDDDVVDHETQTARYDFKQKLGRAIAELSMGSDEEFLKSCLDSHAALVARRGY